jgi:hypothetical protein
MLNASFSPIIMIVTFHHDRHVSGSRHRFSVSHHHHHHHRHVSKSVIASLFSSSSSSSQSSSRLASLFFTLFRRHRHPSPVTSLFFARTAVCPAGGSSFGEAQGTENGQILFFFWIFFAADEKVFAFSRRPSPQCCCMRMLRYRRYSHISSSRLAHSFSSTLHRRRITLGEKQPFGSHFSNQCVLLQ